MFFRKKTEDDDLDDIGKSFMRRAIKNNVVPNYYIMPIWVTITACLIILVSYYKVSDRINLKTYVNILYFIVLTVPVLLFLAQNINKKLYVSISKITVSILTYNIFLLTLSAYKIYIDEWISFICYFFFYVFTIVFIEHTIEKSIKKHFRINILKSITQPTK